jgi:hypothetical protein
MVLKTPLVFASQPDEFDSHANSGIAGAHQGAGHNPFRPNPKLRAESSSYGKGRKHLDITTATTYIGCRYTNQGELVLESNGKGNFMPGPSPAARRQVGWKLITLKEKRAPWAFHSAQKLHAYFNLLNRSRFPCPYHLASRLLLAGLHSDDVPDLEVMLNLAEPRTRSTDILGTSPLGKATPIGGHTPHTDV